MEPEREILAGILKDLKSHLLAGKEESRRLTVFTRGGGGREEPLATAAAGPSLTLAGVREELGDCRRCELADRRRNLVFGEGDEKAELVFVGEAPGEDEDRQGRPFVGRAGQLLTRIIEAMGLSREDVYICNILKCRPPGNRNPRPEEIRVCEPFLVKQLQAIRPRVICALGTFSAQTLLKVSDPISRLRGRFHAYEGIPLMPTFHPAYLLRNPGSKKQVWEDVQAIMKRLAEGRDEVPPAAAGDVPDKGRAT